MKKKKLEKVDFTVVSPGDKLIIQIPRLLNSHELSILKIDARMFLKYPHESVLIVPEGFKLFLLKKGSGLEIEKKE